MIQIVADTLSCITPEAAAKMGISLLPQIVIFGEKSYRDDSEIDSLKFLQMLKVSKALPSTAAPAPVLYQPIFQKVKENHDTALVICPSAKVSGTVRSVEKAAAEFPEADIRILDTKLIASGLGSIVEYAVKCVKQGMSIDELIQNVNVQISKSRTYFMVDTLEYLKKGGRIGAASAFIGSLLDMKPILAFRNGQIEPVEKQRTQKKALARMKELVAEDCARDGSADLVISHGDVFANAEQLAADFKHDIGIETTKIIYPPPAILVHSGPGVLVVSYFAK